MDESWSSGANLLGKARLSGFFPPFLSFLLQGFSHGAKAAREASAHEFPLEDEGNGWKGGGGGDEECGGGERHHG